MMTTRMKAAGRKVSYLSVERRRVRDRDRLCYRIIVQNINVVPDIPYYIRGVINLKKARSSLSWTYGSGSALRNANMTNGPASSLSMSEQSIGLIVDRVSEVLDIPASEIRHPELRKGRSNRFVKGLEKWRRSEDATE